VLRIGHELGFKVSDKKKTMLLIDAYVQVLAVLDPDFGL
jgi:hypothetical protein